MAPRRATKDQYIAIKLAQLAEILRREEYMTPEWQTVFAMTNGNGTEVSYRAVMELMKSLAEVAAGHTAEQPTVTPEDTLRAAGISSRRQARYQRRMSSLLGRGKAGA